MYILDTNVKRAIKKGMIGFVSLTCRWDSLWELFAEASIKSFEKIAGHWIWKVPRWLLDDRFQLYLINGSHFVINTCQQVKNCTYMAFLNVGVRIWHCFIIHTIENCIRKGIVSLPNHRCPIPSPFVTILQKKSTHRNWNILYDVVGVWA